LFKSNLSDKVIKLILLLPLIVLAAAHDEIRPHMFGWLFASLVVFLISKKYYRVIPLVLILWANMHGSFILVVFISLFFILQDYFVVDRGVCNRIINNKTPDGI